MKIYFIEMILFGALLLSCSSNSNVSPDESIINNKEYEEFNFNLKNDLYQECCNIESLFQYAQHADQAIWIDFEKIPEHWICYEGLKSLLEFAKAKNSTYCVQIKSRILYTTVYDIGSNTKDAALYLLRSYLASLTNNSYVAVSDLEVIEKGSEILDTMEVASTPSKL